MSPPLALHSAPMPLLPALLLRLLLSLALVASGGWAVAMPGAGAHGAMPAAMDAPGDVAGLPPCHEDAGRASQAAATPPHGHAAGSTLEDCCSPADCAFACQAAAHALPATAPPAALSPPHRVERPLPRTRAALGPASPPLRPPIA